MNKIIFTLIGVIVGSIVSGVFVGMNCAKTYKKQIEDLEADNEYLRDQLHNKKEKDIQKREEKALEDEVEVNASLMTQLAMAREEKRKTKEMVKTLSNLKVEGKALIMLPEKDENVQKSARNIENVKTTLVNTINVYDLLKYNKLVITLDTIKKLEEVYA